MLHGYASAMADRPDGFDFVKDGTILCFIDGDQWKLRRPKTGEYKAFRLAARDHDDEVIKLQQDGLAGVTRREGIEVGEGESAEISQEEAAEQLRHIREANRESTDRREDLNRAWMADVFGVLADHPLPEDRDDWPVWLWQTENVIKFQEHWRTDPLVRSPH